MTRASQVAVSVKLLGDVSDFAKGMRKAQLDAAGFSQKLKVGMRQATVGAAAGLAVLSTAIGKGVKDYETLIASTASLQRQSKIGAKAASLLVGQWQRYGVTIEKGTKSTVILAKAMDDVNQKGKDSASADYFKRLGISMETLKTSSPAEVLELVRQKLSAMPPGAERTAIAAKLLGKGFVGMSKWINASTGDIKTLNRTLAESGQTLNPKELAEGKQQLKDQADLQVQIRGLWIQIGQSVMPYLKPLVKMVTDVTMALNPWAAQLKYVAAGLVGFLVIAKVVALAGPLVSILSNLHLVTKLVAAAQWLWNAALTANPIGIIIVAVAAFVAAFVILWKKCDWFRNFWIGLWEKVKAVFAAVWPVIQAVLGWIVAGFITNWNLLKTIVLAFWDWAGPFITQAIDVWWKVIKRVMGWIVDRVREAWPIIKEVIRRNIDTIKTVIDGIKTVVAVIAKVWSTIHTAAEAAWSVATGIAGVVKDGLSTIVDLPGKWLKRIKDAVADVWTEVKKVVKTAWVGEDGNGGIVGVVSGAWGKITGFIGKITGAIDWVIGKLNKLAGTSIGTIGSMGGGGRQSEGGGGGTARSVGNLGSSTGMAGVPHADDDGGGKGGILGGIGSALSGAAGWVSDLWNKYGIGSKLPGTIGGLFGNASGLILSLAKDAVVALLTKYGGGPGQAIIDFATSRLGDPYVWAARSRADSTARASSVGLTGWPISPSRARTCGTRAGR